MSSILSKIFSPNNTTSFHSLRKQIVKWKQSNVYPFKTSLPQEISLPSSFWKKVIKLFKETRADEHERSISVFWVDGEIILTSTVRGGKSRVSSRAKVRVSYKPKLKNNRYDYYERRIWVNDSVYSKKMVYHKNVPKKLEKPVYLFNMHTHPPHKKSLGYASNYNVAKQRVAGDYRGSSSYSYWSAQDIKSFIKSGAVVTGLVTDKLLMLIRTSETPTTISFVKDSQMTPEYLVNDLHLGVYEGDFKSKMKRIS